jgi:hypothetical protein
LQDNTDVPEAIEELRTTPAGFVVQVGPEVGLTLVDRATVPAKPLTPVTTRVEDPEAPDGTVIDAGPTDRVKSCTV